MKRRSLLAGMLATPLLAATPAFAEGGIVGNSNFATAILSPHQDDEIIRFAAYIIHAADRGDNLALIQATDGAATTIGRKLGLTPEETSRYRNREQFHSWDNLTDGRTGNVTYLNFPDGGAQANDLYRATKRALESMGGQHECYVATYPPDGPYAYIPNKTAGDAHPDHVACVEAGKMLAADGVVVRYAVHPTQAHRTGGTATYTTNEKEYWRVESAVAAYRTIGQRSTPKSFKYVLDFGGRSVITR